MFYGENFAADKRRALPGSQKAYEPKTLNALHLRIIQLKAGGLKGPMIAELCQCTPQTVSNVINSDLGKRKLRALIAGRDVATLDVKAELEALAKTSVEIMRQALEGQRELTDKDIVGVAKDVIDRAGYSPKNVHLHAHQHQLFSPDEIEDIKRRARESARNGGILADQECDCDGSIVDAEVIQNADD